MNQHEKRLEAHLRVGKVVLILARHAKGAVVPRMK